jgi:hypothetical protein
MAARQPQQQEQQQQEQEGVIERFTNEGEGWLGVCARGGGLTYTGGITAGKAEGRGTVRCGGGITLRDADFRGGRMLPCRAVLAFDNGDAFAGPLAAGGQPADGARGAVVRGRDGGQFQGEWPAAGARNNCFCPRRGAAWDARDGRVWPVALDGEEGICSGEPGWAPGGAHAGWGPALGVMERPTAQQVRPDPPRPRRPACAARRAAPRRAAAPIRPPAVTGAVGAGPLAFFSNRRRLNVDNRRRLDNLLQPPAVNGCVPTAVTARAPIRMRAAAGRYAGGPYPTAGGWIRSTAGGWRLDKADRH